MVIQSDYLSIRILDHTVIDHPARSEKSPSLEAGRYRRDAVALFMIRSWFSGP
jgi:hypothetical protein